MAKSETKSKRLPTAKQLERTRVTQARKAITKQLRKVEKIERAFATAQSKLQAEIGELQGDVRTQLEQVLGQLGVAVTVTQAEIESQANALARTFVKR